tara:strand:- start:26748 stop:28433 length:1686 start_codon:yes stop_codon:yes gene_type:complete
MITIFISLGAFSMNASDTCKSLLGFIHKELTVDNFEKSVDRMNKKMVLALISAANESDKLGVKLSKDPELLSLLESMKHIDPNLESFLLENQNFRSYNFWKWLPFIKEPHRVSYQEVVHKWKDLQVKRPYLFKNLEDKHALDEWDTKTAQLLDSYPTDSSLGESADKTARLFKNAHQELVDDSLTDSKQLIIHLKKNIEELHKEVEKSAKDLLLQSLDDYKYVCSSKDLGPKFHQLACGTQENLRPVLDATLKDISDILDHDYLYSHANPPSSGGRIKIRDYDYKNINHAASYCKRNPNVVDTVVIHHSETQNTASPQLIHNIQVVAHEDSVDKNGKASPWYMIAYNYVVSAEYEGEGKELPKVYRGRPKDMKGAHAGGYVDIDKMNPEAKKALFNSSPSCGLNTDKDPSHIIDVQDYRAQRTYQKNLNKGIASANLTSVGVLVIGNYAPDIVNNALNPTGYPSDGPPRFPSTDALRSSAKLICQLRRDEHPNLTKITDHNYIKIKRNYEKGKRYAGTCCPGTVYLKMQKLYELTKEECPEFDFTLDISPKETVCPFLRKL